MASAQEPSLVRLEVETPSGRKYNLLTAHVAMLGPSGSADGVIASTPEKWVYLPTSKTAIPVNSKLIVSVNLTAADGIDYSDCGIQIPFTRMDGSLTILSNGDLTGSDLAAASTAGVYHQLATYTFTEQLRFGGGKIFISVEDDTS